MSNASFILDCTEDHTKRIFSNGIRYEIRVETTPARRDTRTMFRFFEDGREIGYAIRTLDTSDKSVKHGYFRLDDGAAPGTGSTFVRNSVVAYRRRGIERIDISADLEAGGYVWARMGFRPCARSWRILRDELRTRLAAIAGDLDDDVCRRLENAIASEDPEAIWDIADQRDEFNRQPIGRYLLSNRRWEGSFDLT